MGGFPVQFLCLCFGISLAPRLFTKLIIASISILRNFYIRIRVYLDTSETIVNAGGVNKRPSQAFGNIIINSVSNSSFTTVHEIPAETTNLQPLFEKRLQQQSSSRCTLQRGISNLYQSLSYGRSVTSHQVEVLIESDASKTGWRAFYKKTSIAGVWSQAEQALHINILGLRAEKFAILTFSIYNKELAALAYLVKMGRTAAPTHDSGGKENMVIFFSQSDHTYCGIPAKDFKYQGRQGFQEMKNSSSEWILNKPIFQKLLQALGPVDVDLFESRLCHQIPRNISWQPDPHVFMVRAFQINWTHLKAYAFPRFALIGRALAKVMREEYTLIIITPVWPSQPCYTQLLRLSIQDPIFTPPFPNLLTDPNQNQHQLCQNQILTLAAWKVSGNSISYKAYQLKQLTRWKVAEDRAHGIITKRSSKSGVPGVFQEKLVSFL